MKNTYTLKQFEEYFEQWLNNTGDKKDNDFHDAVRKYLGEKIFKEAAMDGKLAIVLIEKLTKGQV